jgi:hypothetical protein
VLVVAYGSLAAAARSNWDARFTSESSRGNNASAWPLWAKSRRQPAPVQSGEMLPQGKVQLELAWKRARKMKGETAL